ncbi:MAG TPA: polysaccharide biosynthesis tyrosine autokinase [Gemmatimonadaceae bacterium]|nr:polysaccharide biosynthesis tyrosine autokinase [Gemmatimonadaceae bacterium]
MGESMIEQRQEGLGASADRALPLRNLIAALRHRWWAFALVLALVVGFSTWRTSRKVRLYATTATVRIQELQTGPVSAQSPTRPDYRVDPIQSEQEIIKSKAVAERVAELLGLRLYILSPPKLQRGALFGQTMPEVDSTVEYGAYVVRLRGDGYSLFSNDRMLASAAYGEEVRGGGVAFTIPTRPRIEEDEIQLSVMTLASAGGLVRGGLGTRSRPQTNIVEISYTGPDPVMVAQIANTVAAEYALYTTEQRRLLAIKRTRSTAEAVENQRRELALKQDALTQFKKRGQLSSIEAEQDALGRQIQSFTADRDALLIEQRTYATILGKLTQADTADQELRQLAGTGAIRDNSHMQKLFERWFDLQRQRAELVSQGRNENYSGVQAVDQLIRATKNELQVASNSYLVGLRAQISSLENRINELRREMQKYPELGADEQRLTAEVQTAQQLYASLLGELQRQRIAEASEGGYVTVIDNAMQPFSPVSPNRRRIFLTALIFGSILGLGAAVLLENLDDSVKSPDEVREQFGLSVVGTIPGIKDSDLPGENGAEVARRLATHFDPRSPVAEAYRSLRTNLAFARAHEAMRILVLTSPGPADGKSTTVANLAITFAQQGQRTLLIDGDLRRAVLDKMFKVPRSPGLTDVLVGRQRLRDVVHATEIEHLSVVGSGPFPPNPSELLGSSAMREVLRDAQTEFDVVLIDSPPLLAVTDAAVLATMADGAILVIRVGATAKAAVRRAVAQLQTVHGRVVGAVLNDVDLRSGAFSGSYGYYYYYYYGEGARNGKGGPVERLRQWRAKRAAAGVSSDT